jgi:hypothetical protein
MGVLVVRSEIGVLRGGGKFTSNLFAERDHGVAAMIWGSFPHSDVSISKMVVSSIVACLSKVLKSSPALKARGNVAYRYVQRQHGWAATAERLEKIIISRLGVKR